MRLRDRHYACTAELGMLLHQALTYYVCLLHHLYVYTCIYYSLELGCKQALYYALYYHLLTVAAAVPVASV
jgi:hypothetical protein